MLANAKKVGDNQAIKMARWSMALGVVVIFLAIAVTLTGFFKIAIAALVVIFLSYDYGNTLLSNQRNSYEPLFQYCKKLDSEGVQVSLFKPLERIIGASVFYLKKTVPVFYDEQNLRNFVHSGKRVVAISEERSIEKLNNYDVIKRFKFDNRTYVLVGS